MSPEQARGLDRIDLRSDVWSFAVVLYETIFGETPFQSDNYNALLRLIVETEAPTLQDKRVADAELSAIVQRGMSKHVDDRFASMGQMGRALASWLHDRGITEDACGVSLEARWLSRPSDPSYPGRVSRSSSPGSWPEPPSGVRAVSGPGGRRLGHATTVEASKSAGTPVALVGTLSQPSPRERRAYLLAAAAIALAALVLGWFALGGSRSNEPATPSSATAPLDARPEAAAPRPVVAPAPPTPPVTPALNAAEPPAAAAAPAPPTTAEAAKARTSSTKVPAAKAARAAEETEPAPTTPAPKPASDLLSPY
jgi:serine/threonine protein kinase